MSIASISSNDLLYQTLRQTNNTATSTQNTANVQGTQDSSQFSQILQSLNTDLQSGNLQNAQQDFAQLQQALNGLSNVQGHPHHHHKHASGNSQATNTAQAGSSQGTAQTASPVLSTAVTGVSQQATTASS
jgi:hypothetical protein